MRHGRQSAGNQDGFTLIEMVTVIAAIGILATVAISRFVGAEDSATRAQAIDLVRGVQGLATTYYTENNVPPTTEQMEALYGHGSNSARGKFKVIPMESGLAGAAAGLSGINAAYIICTTMKINHVAYVYGLDDKPPQVAAEGTDPLGLGGQCGAGGGGGSPSTPTPAPTPTPEPMPSPTPEPNLDPTPDPPDDDAREPDSCEADQVCPCNGEWRSHGGYQSCIVHLANACYKAGKISKRQRDNLVQEAAHSQCGR